MGRGRKGNLNLSAINCVERERERDTEREGSLHSSCSYGPKVTNVFGSWVSSMGFFALSLSAYGKGFVRVFDNKRVREKKKERERERERDRERERQRERYKVSF